MYANIVSTIALMLSLASAAAAAYLYLRWNKPVLVVTGTQWITPAHHRSQRRAGFSIEITNVGNQATQILDAYWLIDRGNDLEIRFKAAHGGGGIESLFVSDQQRDDPTYPFTLSRNEQRAWEFSLDPSHLSEPSNIVRCRPVVEYISRKHRTLAYGAWQPSQIALNAGTTV